MREHLPKFIIIALLVLIVGLPILLRPADRSAEVSDDAPRLVIYTPHNEQIRHEIEHAYNDWRESENLPEVVFDWRVPGGTTDIRKGIVSQYQGLIDSERAIDKGIGVDLFFGGGVYDHNKVASGIKVKAEDGSSSVVRIAEDPGLISDPAQREAFYTAFPSPQIGGEQLYGVYFFDEADGALPIGFDASFAGGPSTWRLKPVKKKIVLGWVGVTLSSFGVVYNNDSLDALGLDKPMTWSDLGDPRLRGWVALADPGHSGSLSQTFNTILRREGWAKGWVTLREVYANARYFATDSTRVPVDVSRGDAAAGLCVDFYGRYQSGMVGGGRMGYADPIEQGKSMTATTADPITMLRGAPNAEIAKGFIRWLVSTESQALWQRAKSETDDGLVRPDRYELRRQPIRSDLYTAEQRRTWVDDQLDPFSTAVPFPDGTPDYFGMVAPLTKAMAIDTHDDLVAAWRALNRARNEQHKHVAEMQELFYAMPEELVIQWELPKPLIDWKAILHEKGTGLHDPLADLPPGYTDADLARDWHAIQANPDHPLHDWVVATLEQINTRFNSLARGDSIDAKRVQWRGFFQRNYREVVRLGNE